MPATEPFLGYEASPRGYVPIMSYSFDSPFYDYQVVENANQRKDELEKPGLFDGVVFRNN